MLSFQIMHRLRKTVIFESDHDEVRGCGGFIGVHHRNSVKYPIDHQTFRSQTVIACIPSD